VVAPRRASITLLSDFRARDGRVWFTTPAGLSVYDPRWDQVDSAAPIPHVDRLLESGHPISLELAPEVPPNPDHVTLTFNATARLAPERTRIQYMLQGADRSWVEAGGNRVASYPQLQPGRYTFRVRAWNVDGIPSATEATLAFRVRPAWYQTITFMVGLILLISSATAGAAVGMQRARSRRSTALLTSQFEATLAERVRIAQELHDTLLQGFMGVSLRLKSVELASPGLPAETAERLAHVQAMADEALREARESVWDLRSPELDHADLADALLIRARGETGDAGAEVKLTVTGSRRRLAREVEVTAFRIGSEAVVNGVKHGGARTITIVIDFGDRTLTLSVRDDGRGFSPSEGEAARQQGHWGLVGMRERARRAGGTCEIGPGPNAGTVVMAVLPCGGKRS
jgi:signal transduction histidine kinase